MLYFYGIGSILACLLALASFAYTLYIGSIAIIKYKIYDFLLAVDLMPYIPTLVLSEIIAFMFLITSVVIFRAYRSKKAKMNQVSIFKS